MRRFLRSGCRCRAYAQPSCFLIAATELKSAAGIFSRKALSAVLVRIIHRPDPTSCGRGYRRCKTKWRAVNLDSQVSALVPMIFVAMMMPSRSLPGWFRGDKAARFGADLRRIQLFWGNHRWRDHRACRRRIYFVAQRHDDRHAPTTTILPGEAARVRAVIFTPCARFAIWSISNQRVARRGVKR